MAKKNKTKRAPRLPKTRGAGVTTTDYRHTGEKRTNIPPAKIAAEGKVPKVPKVRYQYSSHLPPMLRFDPSGGTDKLSELMGEAGKRPLTASEQKLLAEALRNDQPWLEWAGKREQNERRLFEVDPVALHIHERVSTQAIIRALAREDVQRDLFADPQQPYAEAVQFYKHDVDWANRLILGDSLQVMASLARRENLAAKVQMIYVDPPYGIKFGSNFQPLIGQRDVKDRDQDLTREAEMVRAYRDTWTLGIHSYLSYLRDRLIVARELLTASGSIFVQISDENLHRVRCLLDEVFGVKNFTSLVSFKTTQSSGSITLDTSCDYVLWYAKDAEHIKYRPLFKQLTRGEKGATRYDYIENLGTGEERRLTEEEQESETAPEGWRLFTDQGLTSRGKGSETTMGKIVFEGEPFYPTVGHWRSRNENLQTRLIPVGRVLRAGKTLRFKKCFNDFGCLGLTNLWDDVGGGITSRDDPKIYVVQTSATIIQRCLLMTTDPGDLVFDPTCGAGTTAYVAEHWGRRWITCETSRVALSLARQRLMTARFAFFELRPLTPEDLQRNPQGTPRWTPENRPSIDTSKPATTGVATETVSC